MVKFQIILFSMHLLCARVCVCFVFNQMYSVLMIRKGTLKLFSFGNGKREGWDSDRLFAEQERWRSEWEKLEHGVELGCSREGERTQEQEEGVPQSRQEILVR